MKQIPFDLEKAKAGAKVVTRDGHPVKLFSFNIRGKLGETIAGTLNREGIDTCMCWLSNGNFSPHRVGVKHDLFLSVEPQFRAWKSEEVPVGAIIRPIKSHGWRSQIGHVSATGRINGCGGINADVQFALTEWLHSIDGGRTFNVCGVAI